MFHSIKNFNAIRIDFFPETKVSIYFSFGMVEVSIRFSFSTATELMSGHQFWCNLHCFLIYLPWYVPCKGNVTKSKFEDYAGLGNLAVFLPAPKIYSM